MAAEETLVSASFRNKSIRVRTAVTSHQDQPGKVTVKALVLDAKETRLELGQKEVALEPGKPQDLTFEKPWPDAHLWSPQDPYLYVLAVETRNADGKVIDRAYERFGFRETSIKGPSVMLNGHAAEGPGVHLRRSDAYVGDALLSRGTHGLADYYDEFGYLSTEQLGDITNTSSKHNVERKRFGRRPRRTPWPARSASRTIRRSSPGTSPTSGWAFWATAAATRCWAPSGSRNSPTRSRSRTPPAGRSSTATETSRACTMSFPHTTCTRSRTRRTSTPTCPITPSGGRWTRILKRARRSWSARTRTGPSSTAQRCSGTASAFGRSAASSRRASRSSPARKTSFRPPSTAAAARSHGCGSSSWTATATWACSR